MNSVISHKIKNNKIINNYLFSPYKCPRKNSNLIYYITHWYNDRVILPIQSNGNKTT